MTRTSAVLMMITACFAVTAAQQPLSQPPSTERIAGLLATGRVSYSSYTDRSLSASVIGQFVSWQPGEIGLAVLLRGTERWYMASPRSSSGGGSQGSYHRSYQFGSIRIDLTLDRTRLSATVNNVEVSLADGQNVLLVDGVDTQDRPSVKAIRADLSSPNAASGLIEELATSTLAQIFRRSAEIVSFLQCDAPANQVMPFPGLPAEYAATIYVCEDLKAK